MRITHSCSCLPGGVCLSASWDTPKCGPRDTPQVWAWRHPQARPLNFPPPMVWAWRPLQARLLNFPPGCGPGDLQGMLRYHPPTPGDLQGMLEYHPPGDMQSMLGYHLQCMLEYTPHCEQNSWHTLLKILPCPNFVAGVNKLDLEGVSIAPPSLGSANNDDPDIDPHSDRYLLQGLAVVPVGAEVVDGEVRMEHRVDPLQHQLLGKRLPAGTNLVLPDQRPDHPQDQLQVPRPDILSSCKISIDPLNRVCSLAGIPWISFRFPDLMSSAPVRDTRNL